MTRLFQKKITAPALALLGLAAACSMPAFSQTVEADASASAADNVYGSTVANVRKATAVVNGEIITGSDVDERLALLLESEQDQSLSGEQLELARQQVLANLVDETLQIQEAEAKDIVISDAEIDSMFDSLVQRNGAASVDEFSKQLYDMGSSPRSLKRQIKAEVAWQRVLGREVSPFVNIGDEEVNAVLDRMVASKGTTELRIGEIYLNATPETMPSVAETARTIIESIQQGGSFAGYARQFSQASTASRGGDLGWVRPEMLPSTFVEALNSLSIGQIAGPIPAPGGVSILYLIDRRQVLGTDMSNANLSLKQVYINFEPGTASSQVESTIEKFAAGVSQIKGCGDAENVAAELGAEVISRNDIKLGELPGPLRSLMTTLPIGQSTPPYGSPEDGVRAFVLCGREVPTESNMPSAEQIRDNLEQDRINKKARIYLRDLRQDAIIRYN